MRPARLRQRCTISPPPETSRPFFIPPCLSALLRTVSSLLAHSAWLPRSFACRPFITTCICRSWAMMFSGAPMMRGILLLCLFGWLVGFWFPGALPRPLSLLTALILRYQRCEACHSRRPSTLHRLTLDASSAPTRPEVSATGAKVH